VAEQELRGTDVHHIIRYLDRLPLGTPYPGVAERIKTVVSRAATKAGASSLVLYVDATGVGTPVVDIIRRAGVKARVVPVYFTHGDRRNLVEREVRLGKAWLVSRLQLLLQGDFLHLPRSAEAEALSEELLDYEIRVDENANDKYGAFKVGTHDDLVTALGLATQEDRVGDVPVSASSRGPFALPRDLPFSGSLDDFGGGGGSIYIP
jgi:hypothetical protein